MANSTYEHVIEEIRQLTPEEQRRLREDLTHIVVDSEALIHRQRRTSYGALAYLGQAPSADEIDKARYEAWASFPRDDI